MFEKENAPQKLNELLNLNINFIHAFKELIIPLINPSNKYRIHLPQNILYIESEMYRISQEIYQLIGGQDYEKFCEANLHFLEANKELTNVLIAFSEKNGIPVSLDIYHLVYEGNKFYLNVISEQNSIYRDHFHDKEWMHEDDHRTQ